MTTVCIDYFGMPGVGKTLKAAREDAGRKIKKAIEADYRPRVLACKGEAAMVFFTPHGIRSEIIMSEGKIHSGEVRGSCCHNTDDFEQVCENVKYHLAQNAWEEADGEVPPAFLDEERKHQFQKWARTQLLCIEGQKRGVPFDKSLNYAALREARIAPEIAEKAAKAGLDIFSYDPKKFAA